MRLAFAAGGAAATNASPGNPIRDKDPLGARSTVTREYAPVTEALPIWGARVRAMGVDLPLPFGVGGNLVYMEQGLRLGGLKLGINDTAPAPSGITFGDSRDEAGAVNARADLWLFPFANVYVMGGALGGTARLDIDVPGFTIDDPILGPIPITDPFKVREKLDYKGGYVGLGLTLAAGHGPFFTMVDANYSWASVDIVDGLVQTLSVTPKLGMVIETRRLPGTGAVFLGAMYVNFDLTIRGVIPGEEIDPALAGETLRYQVDAAPREPWNFVFGGAWELDKRWGFVAQAGIGDRKHVILGGTFRF